MKPEFTEVLLPDGKGKYPVSAGPDMSPPSSVRVSPENISCQSGRLCAGHISLSFLVLIVMGLGIGLISRYESKFAAYENRISALETDLALFVEQLELEEEHHSPPAATDTSPTKFSWHDDDPTAGSYEDEEEEEEGLGFGIPFPDEIDDDDEDDENEAEEIVFGVSPINSFIAYRSMILHKHPVCSTTLPIHGKTDLWH